MSAVNAPALTWDSGGTILDERTGFRHTPNDMGAKHGLDRDWPTLNRELRHRS